jgi:protein-disulfide isomerase
MDEVQSIEERDEVIEEKTPLETVKKQNQNLVALSIVLLGLLIGSVLVDAVQLVRREGFSVRALKTAGVVEMAGKTWVAYTDPKIDVKVLNDVTCTACNADQALVSLRKAMPTIEATVVDISTPEGKALVSQGKVKSLPAFFFGASVDRSAVFEQAGPLFTKLDTGWYSLDTNKIGLPAGKFLTLPEVGDNALAIGNPDAKVKVVEFSDWQCPYCKAFQPAVKQMLDEYKDKVYFVYKQFPLTSIHPQAQSAALAVECANEQGAGKWFAYGDNLFTTQAEWSKTTDTKKFKDYARVLKLDGAKFDQCLDSKKYADKVASDQAQGESFGISGTPGTFVGGQFLGGFVDYASLKKVVDEELAKN